MPLIQDAVVTGHDRDKVGLLIFPNIEGAARLAGVDPSAPLAEIIASEKVQKALCQGLAGHNQENPGSSNRIARVLFLLQPPNVDAGEITDKGYISQRVVLERRADQVERLYHGASGVMHIQ